MSLFKYFCLVPVLAFANAVYANGDFCDRTPAVINATLMQLNILHPPTSGGEQKTCASVTPADLLSIKTLDLHLAVLFDENLTGFKEGDFAGFSNLEKLDLANNLTEGDEVPPLLPARLFKGLTALKTLDLSSNMLEELPDLSDLQSLEILTLDENSLTGDALMKAKLNTLTALQELNLMGNNLFALKADIFKGMASLQKIDLSSNSLFALPESLFQGLTFLRVIYLDQNQLASVPSGLFRGLHHLLSLNLYQNKLTSLPAELFSDNPDLGVVNAIENYFSEAEQARIVREYPKVNFAFQR
jgi:hypothetical protein